MRQRSSETHESKTDPEARLFKKSSCKEALLRHSLHRLMENRNTLLLVTEANIRSERRGAVTMLRHVNRRHWFKPRTIGEDAGYRGKERAQEQADFRVKQRIVGIKGRKPKALPASKRARRAIEKIFGWFKTVGGLKRRDLSNAGSPSCTRWRLERLTT